MIALGLAAIYTRGEFNEYNQAEARQVRLIDAWSYLSGNKSSLSEHWAGTYIDVKSGKTFEYQLSGSLYRQFDRDNKPIDLTLSLKPEYWNADRAGNASTYEFLFWLSAVMLAYSNLRWVFKPDEKIYPNDKWFCL
jgi:hypothetical protein